MDTTGLFILKDKNIVPYEIKEKKVIFMSVNDAFVMDEWNKLHGDKQIDAVSDPIAEFSTRMNEKVDWGKQFGVRCNRFAYLIEDGQIVKKFDDPFIEGVMKEL